MRISGWVLVGVVGLAAMVAGAQSAPAAQSVPTQQSVETELRQPFLMLRGMYAGNSLSFDAQGNLIGSANPWPFGLSGVLVKSVKLTDSNLTVTGARAGLLFQDLPVVKGRQQLIAEPVDRKGKSRVTVTIARDLNHPEALEPAIARVFSIGIDGSLAEAAPDYWRDWLIDNLHPELKPPKSAAPATGSGFQAKVRGKVSAPELIYDPNPTFTDAARANHLSGIVVIGLIVDDNGSAQSVKIVRPLGMGLDEAAMLVVSHYRFKPAMLNDQPVPVKINIEVNFRVY
ncbi:MAG TPA: energy transducer TonB [Acidobacteriaceae bacterium]|jgi:TonB family protein|nr:energy transducer TonB [Acidobacteriaceae bacterium]